MASANSAPGIDINFRSFSQRITAPGEVAFGTLGVFTKGPVNERRRISSVDELVEVFGEPDSFSASYFLPIAKILEESPVEVVRVEESTVKCASFTLGVSGGEEITTSTPIETGAYPLTYDTVFSTEQIDLPSGFTDTMTIAAIGPGESYENVSVAVINYADYALLSDFRASLADATTPAEVQSVGQTAYTLSLSGSGLTQGIAEEIIDPDASYDVNTQLLDEYLAFEKGPSSEDEFVIYEYVNGAFQQPYLVSSDPNAKDRYAKSSFANKVVANFSENIRVFVGKSLAGASSVTPVSIPKTSLSGADTLSSTAVLLTDELYQQLNDAFYSKEDVEILALVDLDFPDAIKRRMDEICQVRKDCIALLNVPADKMINVDTEQKVANQTSAIKAWADSTLNVDSSFSALYANYFKVYDQYNDEYRWVPCTGHVANRFGFTDNQFEIWNAVAGLERGVLSGIDKVAYNPNTEQQKVIYPARINPIMKFRGEGVLIGGNKTLQSAATATDRINVRQLLNFIGKQVEAFSRTTLFKQNDEFTRTEWRSIVGPFLNSILQRRGIEDYRVICNLTNNPPEVVARNEFQAYILVRPTTVAEFIKITIADVGGTLTIDEALAGISAS